MRQCREWGTMAAMGRRRLQWSVDSSLATFNTYLYVFLRRKHEAHTTIMMTMSPMAPAPLLITSRAVEIYLTPVCIRLIMV